MRVYLYTVQDVEFIHINPFTNHYYRLKAAAPLSLFIDFFWETDFDSLWEEYPQGFSDVLSPNIGYTYLINFATPFVMQLNEEKLLMKTDGFCQGIRPLSAIIKPETGYSA